MNDKRFVLFLGKGGVGKTTISSAYALQCAKKGKKTLFLSIRSSDKVSRVFQKEISDREIVKLEDNLFATTVTPEYALEEYVLLKLKVRFIYKAVFENKIVSAFLSAIPGLNDLVMLGKAYWHVIEKKGDDYVWDKVIVDAPATGHGIFFLQIPSVIAEILSTGNMYEEAIRMQNVLADHETTELNLVTLAEEMPVNESLMMLKTAKDSLKLPISHVIVNCFFTKRFESEQMTTLVESTQIDSNPDDLQSHTSTHTYVKPEVYTKAPLFDRIIEAAKFRLSRQISQQEQLDTIKKHVSAIVPYLFTKDLNYDDLETIGSILDQQLEASSIKQDFTPYASNE